MTTCSLFILGNNFKIQTKYIFLLSFKLSIYTVFVLFKRKSYNISKNIITRATASGIMHVLDIHIRISHLNCTQFGWPDAAQNAFSKWRFYYLLFFKLILIAFYLYSNSQSLCPFDKFIGSKHTYYTHSCLTHNSAPYMVPVTGRKRILN